MPVTIKEVDSLPGLVQTALELAKIIPDSSFLWFRGLERSSHQLQPKIMRDHKTADEVFERERRLLTRFRQRSLAYWPAGYPQDDWEHLFAMQHYGMPTRLLDWSENLFVATHFALGTTSGNFSPDDPPAIWCLDPITWNRGTPVLSEFGEAIQILTTADDEIAPYKPNTNRKRNRTPVALYGTHNSNRIVAQRGTFMIWGNDTKTLEEFAAESNVQIWKILIKGDRETLARDMATLGFGETMVFPEMPSLATELSKTESWR